MRCRQPLKAEVHVVRALGQMQRVFVLDHGIGKELVHIRSCRWWPALPPEKLIAGRMLDGMPGSPTVWFKLPIPLPAGRC